MYAKAIRIGGAAAIPILLVVAGCGPSDAAGDSEDTLISEGGRIAFTRLTSFEESDLESEVYAINVDGSGEKRLTDSPGFDGLSAWSPDGEWIVFTTERDGNWELYVMDADGSGRTRLTDIPGNDNWPPTWSPDGTRIAFTSDGAGSDGKIQAMNSDGSGLTELTDGRDYDAFPAWRP